MLKRVDKRSEIREKFYPEVQAGGYSRFDTTTQFYLRIRSLLNKTDAVLDIGAGRGGGIATVDPEFRRNLMILRGSCRKIVGIDVNVAVLENPYMDETHVVKVGERFPFDDVAFDLIYADWTLEHVADPAIFVAEIRRVLKPGGWFCARTPNALSYQGLVTGLIPNRLHMPILKVLQPNREERDVFETYLKMNTTFALRRLFSEASWRLVAYAWNGEPAYVGNSAFLWRLTEFLNWISPPSFRTILLVFANKINAERGS